MSGASLRSGALPPNPRSLSPGGSPDGQGASGEDRGKGRQGHAALPIRTTHLIGARVALQRCPVLRPGEGEPTTGSLSRNPAGSVIPEIIPLTRRRRGPTYGAGVFEHSGTVFEQLRNR
jgi:hypothetical protein